MAGFEREPDKELANVEKHGFDFTTASLIWDGPVSEKIDDRGNYGETRIIATGQVNGVPLVVAYTPRGENRRIISARKANSREKSRFEGRFRSPAD
jgi:uncharacterized DUF497 family protein